MKLKTLLLASVTLTILLPGALWAAAAADGGAGAADEGAAASSPAARISSHSPALESQGPIPSRSPESQTRGSHGIDFNADNETFIHQVLAFTEAQEKQVHMQMRKYDKEGSLASYPVQASLDSPPASSAPSIKERMTGLETRLWAREEWIAQALQARQQKTRQAQEDILTFSLIGGLNVGNRLLGYFIPSKGFAERGLLQNIAPLLRGSDLGLRIFTLTTRMVTGLALNYVVLPKVVKGGMTLLKKGWQQCRRNVPEANPEEDPQTSYQHLLKLARKGGDDESQTYRLQRALEILQTLGKSGDKDAQALLGTKFMLDAMLITENASKPSLTFKRTGTSLAVQIKEPEGKLREGLFPLDVELVLKAPWRSHMEIPGFSPRVSLLQTAEEWLTLSSTDLSKNSYGIMLMWGEAMPNLFSQRTRNFEAVEYFKESSTPEAKANLAKLLQRQAEENE